MAPVGQLRYPGHIAFLVASAAGGADVVFRKQRRLPECDVAVSALLIGGETLTAMADRTAELGGDMWTESSVIAVRFWRILHGGIIDTEMARGAAVDAL